jgi:hypothetical protein
VVDPERRWYLVSYVRHLQAQPTDTDSVSGTKAVE